MRKIFMVAFLLGFGVSTPKANPIDLLPVVMDGLEVCYGEEVMKSVLYHLRFNGYIGNEEWEQLVRICAERIKSFGSTIEQRKQAIEVYLESHKTLLTLGITLTADVPE
ncbi:hypothetical protein [Helicobacter sp. T3_23-1056]